MITLYWANTSNGRKVTIMLEACGLPYTLERIDLGADEQFGPTLTAVSPASKIPAIVDDEGPGDAPYPVFESGAILLYLAEKSGRFLPSDPAGRFETIQWLMFQMAGIGPVFGQVHHFARAASERVPYALDRYGGQCRTAYGVLDRRLSAQPFLGPELSIADFATLPWVHRHPWQSVDLANDFPHVQRWYQTLLDIPEVVRGMHLED